MRKPYLILPAGFLAGLVCPGLVQATELEQPVVVSATRLPQSANETLASVTVITADDIQKSQARFLADVLEGQPGVFFSRNGGAGKSASLFMRGTASDHVLVLVDGVRVGSATLGTFSFADFPAHMIERVEIVRGPRSSLYGADAIGGVIQIFTRKGASEPLVTGGLGFGSDQTVQGDLRVSGSRDKAYGSLGLQGFDTQGENSCRTEAGVDFRGCYASEPDKDGYRNQGVNAAAGYAFSPGNLIELSGHYVDYENEYDGFYNRSEGDQNQLTLHAEALPSDAWSVSFTAGRAEDNSDNFSEQALPSRFNTQKDSATLINAWQATDRVLLSFGVDYLQESIDTVDVFTVNERDNLGGFVQVGAEYGAFNVELSGRHDENEAFGSQMTGGLAVGYALTSSLRVTGSYGTAFKAPTFNELYYPGYGNPNLQPEESETTELGLKYQDVAHTAYVTVYDSRVDNLIAADSTNNFSPANISEARIRGLETGFGFRRDVWQWGADLSVVHAENQDAGYQGKQLPRRPERTLKVFADYTAERWSSGLDVIAAGQAWDDLANTQPLARWTRFDLRADYALTPDWLLQGKIENLLDEDYETAGYYIEPGLGYQVSIRYQPKS